MAALSGADALPLLETKRKPQPQNSTPEELSDAACGACFVNFVVGYALACWGGVYALPKAVYFVVYYSLWIIKWAFFVAAFYITIPCAIMNASLNGPAQRHLILDAQGQGRLAASVQLLRWHQWQQLPSVSNDQAWQSLEHSAPPLLFQLSNNSTDNLRRCLAVTSSPPYGAFDVALTNCSPMGAEAPLSQLFTSYHGQLMNMGSTLCVDPRCSRVTVPQTRADFYSLIPEGDTIATNCSPELKLTPCISPPYDTRGQQWAFSNRGANLQVSPVLDPLKCIECTTQQLPSAQQARQDPATPDLQHKLVLTPCQGPNQLQAFNVKFQLPKA